MEHLRQGYGEEVVTRPTASCKGHACVAYPEEDRQRVLLGQFLVAGSWDAGFDLWFKHEDSVIWASFRVPNHTPRIDKPQDCTPKRSKL